MFTWLRSRLEDLWREKSIQDERDPSKLLTRSVTIREIGSFSSSFAPRWYFY
jgi:hypothetical protein